MATTGPELQVSHLIGTGAGTVVGQGNLPELVCMIAFDDLSVSTPTWVDMTARVRGFSVQRGRSSELASFDTGTAAVTLDNSDRALEPLYSGSPYYPNVRPWNRLWLREQFSGETQDLFKGYVDAYPLDWPDGGWSDAIVKVTASDEFKPLGLDNLPVSNPPRDTYANLIAYDDPSGYWPMGDDPATAQQADESGPDFIFTPPDDPGGGPTEWDAGTPISMVVAGIGATGAKIPSKWRWPR